MKDNTIYFRIGTENKPVVETSRFENSIFIKQYRTALEITDHYLQNSSKSFKYAQDGFQGLAFCGERGDGKTSAMLSFLNILKLTEATQSISESEYIERQILIENLIGKDASILKEKTVILDLIDPTQFVNYNIIEVILSQIFNALNQLREQKKRERHNIFNYDELLLEFQSVKHAIEILSKKDNSIFDALEDFNELSDAIRLKPTIHSLIKNFLEIFKASHLIIPIDDVDLQMNGVYEMVELLRKYFALPEVIVVMAVKPKQLFSAIEHALRMSVNEDEKSFSEYELETMTEKYLIKLLPQNCRVHMPGVEGIFDRKLVILDRNGVNTVFSNETFKDGVLELIFMRTRYLFYNSLGGTSTLFPTNLRELFHLVGLVAEMKPFQVNGDDIHRLNQWNFKNYFFGFWTESLKKEHRIKAKAWCDSVSDNTLNKDIVIFLRENFKPYLNRNISTEIEEEAENETDAKTDNVQTIKDSILNPNNYTYNVSVGDVFFILDIIENEILPDDDYRFIFFIRSLYSIKLYDKYDSITHNSMVFPMESPSGGIYRNDERFSNVNLLQRLVGVSFFTFPPSKYITFMEKAKEKEKDKKSIICDRRIIKGSDGLHNLIDHVVKGNGTDLGLMKLAEFFIITVPHYIASKEKMSSKNIQTYPVEFMKDARESSDPIAFSKYSAYRGFYEFNILAPFSNIINIKYTYERFPNGDKLFDLALKNKESLLCCMWKASFISRGYSESEWEKIHEDTIRIIPSNVPYDAETNERLSDALGTLLSDGIIRNAEVMVALSDHFKRIGKEISRAGFKDPKSSREVKILNKLQTFYSKISSPASSMTTHRFEYPKSNQPSESSRHRISFKYISALSDFLKQLENTNSEDVEKSHEKEVFRRFFNIFDWNKDEVAEKKISKKENRLINNLKSAITMLFNIAAPLKQAKKCGYDLFDWINYPTIDSQDREYLLSLLNEINKESGYDLWNGDITIGAWKERMERLTEKWNAVLTHSLTIDYINQSNREQV